MKNKIARLVATSALILAFFTSGCARTVEKTSSTTTSSDGTVKTKEKTITENPDGTVTKKEETHQNSPSRP